MPLAVVRRLPPAIGQSCPLGLLFSLYSVPGFRACLCSTQDDFNMTSWPIASKNMRCVGNPVSDCAPVAGRGLKHRRQERRTVGTSRPPLDRQTSFRRTKCGAVTCHKFIDEIAGVPRVIKTIGVVYQGREIKQETKGAGETSFDCCLELPEK